MLALIMLFLCAAVLGCAFLTPKNNKSISADAAVTKSKVIYTPTECLQYVHNVAKTSVNSIPYSAFGAVNTEKGVCEFDAENKIVKMSKLNIGYYQLVAYVSFYSSVEVPAYTEYKVDHTFTAVYKRTANTGSTTAVGISMFYYGNTNDPTACDKSPEIDFRAHSDGTTTPATYLIKDEYSSNNTQKTSSANVTTITYTNDTSETVTYTAYFGFLMYSNSGTSYSSTCEATFTMADKVTVTAVDAPTVDHTVETYDGSDKIFDFVYDKDKIAVVSVKRKNTANVISVQYSYDLDTGTAEGENPVDTNGLCALKQAGVYTFEFAITSGSVWDSATEDQSNKFLTVYVLPKPITKPTVATADVNGREYTGKKQDFALSSKDTSATTWSDIIKVSGVLPVGVTDNANGSFGITDVGSYSFKLELVDEDNTVWSDTKWSESVWNSSDRGGNVSLTLKVTQKQLTVALGCNYEKNGLWKWGIGADDASITVTVSGFALSEDADGSSENRVTLSYYYLSGADTAENPLVTEILEEVYDPETKTIKAKIIMPSSLQQGGYTFGVKPDGSTGANGNYSVNAQTATKAFTIGKQELDPDSFTWTYLESIDDEGADGRPLEFEGTSIKYKLVSGTSVSYTLSINTGDFADIFDVGEYSNRTQSLANDNVTGTGYITTVRLTITDEDYSFDATKSYEHVTVYSATEAEFKIHWYIMKGDVDETKVTTPSFQYRFGATGEWKDYNPDNPPEYTGSNMTVQLKQPLPEGVTSATVDNYLDDQKGPGDLRITVTYAVNSNYNTLGTKTYTIKISPKIIDSGALGWDYYRDGGEIVKDAHNVPYQIRALVLEDASYKDFIDYEYYLVDLSTGTPQPGAFIGYGNNALAVLTDPAGEYKVSSTNSKAIMIKPVLNGNVPLTAAGIAKYAVKDVTGSTLTNEATGENGYIMFTLGESRDLATVTVNKTSSVYSDSVNYEEILSITLADGSPLSASFYTLTVYRNSISTDNFLSELSSFDFAAAPAGLYVIEIALTDEESYALTEAFVKFTVEKKPIALPTQQDIVFSGNTVSLADVLGGTYLQYKDIIEISGSFKDIRNVGSYQATLTLTDENYKWEEESPVTTVRFTLAEGETGITATGESTALCLWNIIPLIVDTTNLWNKGKDGATLNLPAQVSALVEGGTLEVGYKYYDAAGQYLESPEIKGGRSFKVEAVLGGIDAEYGNVMFIRSDGAFATASESVDYTVPQSGAAAFVGNALSFVKSNWLWFVIGLAVLIFLIILICIIAHRRKNKEERQAKKEAKEEEKRKREEEREAAKAKREAELELQRAKQEAELAKLKAQAGLGAGVAGAAGLAMAMQQPAQAQQQMPQQQPYQAPAQAQLPMPQQPYPQMQAMPQQMMQYPSIQQPQYPQMQQGYDAASNARITQLEMEVAKMKAESEIRTVGIDERAKTAYFAPMPSMLMRQPERADEGTKSMGMTAELLGDAILTALTKLVESKAPVALPQSVEESKPVSVAYPPDAVVTTTTTVDTTKSLKPLPRSDDNRMFDIDGFYDAFDENK